jgi:hypothetical protein
LQRRQVQSHYSLWLRDLEVPLSWMKPTLNPSSTHSDSEENFCQRKSLKEYARLQQNLGLASCNRTKVRWHNIQIRWVHTRWTGFPLPIRRKHNLILKIQMINGKALTCEQHNILTFLWLAYHSSLCSSTESSQCNINRNSWYSILV